MRKTVTIIMALILVWAIMLLAGSAGCEQLNALAVLLSNEDVDMNTYITNLTGEKL